MGFECISGCGLRYRWVIQKTGIEGDDAGMRKTPLTNLRRDQEDFPARVIRTQQAKGAKNAGRYSRFTAT